MLEYIKRNLERTILFAFILVLFLPFILTRDLDGISFKDTGQIGDTIGGISAPIIGLLGAILLYLALMEQRDATLLQKNAINDQKDQFKKEREYEIIMSLIKEMKDEFNSLSLEISSPPNHKAEYRGPKILWLFHDVLQQNNYTHIEKAELKQLILKYTFILKQFAMTVDKIYSSSIEKQDKIHFLGTIETYKSPLGMFSQAIQLKGNSRLFPTYSNDIDVTLKALVQAFGLLENDFQTKKREVAA